MPDVLQRIVRVAARVTRATAAEINVITGASQHTLASTGPELMTCRAEDSFCARIVQEAEREHLVPDARQDARFKDNPHTIAGDVVTYAASQLVTPNSVPIGTLCVFDPEHKEIDAEMMEVLSDLSWAAMDVLEARRHHDELEGSFTQLTDDQRELRRSNEHLAAFAGQVSHDIQGPLAGVLMALQMLEEELDNDAVLDEEHRVLFLRRALSSAERMRATVTGLMDFAALGGAISPTRLEMSPVVKDVIADLAAHVGAVRLEVAEDLPVMWGDEVQVRAVVQNLVSNAVKYAGHVPNPRICVSGTHDGETSSISVSDNGPGVPTSQREAIFGLLVRGEGAASTEVEGLGIGLATCRRIVQSHGGDLGVRDSATGGAAFWFELPLPPASRS
jgi:signal transduction histidine kinase